MTHPESELLKNIQAEHSHAMAQDVRAVIEERDAMRNVLGSLLLLSSVDPDSAGNFSGTFAAMRKLCRSALQHNETPPHLRNP